MAPAKCHVGWLDSRAGLAISLHFSHKLQELSKWLSHDDRTTGIGIIIIIIIQSHDPHGSDYPRQGAKFW